MQQQEAHEHCTMQQLSEKVIPLSHMLIYSALTLPVRQKRTGNLRRTIFLVPIIFLGMTQHVSIVHTYWKLVWWVCVEICPMYCQTLKVGAGVIR